jgi:AraC-like DNA-binding protein
LDLVQPNINLFAFLILLGVVQGFILVIFFLNKKHKAYQPNIFIGLLMLVFALISLDVFLCYTGYMAKVAFLNNFTESFNFLISPLFYFYILSSIKGKIHRRQLWHLLPFILYTLYNLIYLAEPTEFKYYDYVSAYFPQNRVTEPLPPFQADPLFLRQFLFELTFLSFISYYLYSFTLIIKAFRNEKISLFIKHYKNLTWLRNFMLALLCLIIITTIVKFTFGRDTGDYLITSFFSIIIYGTSVNVIKSSVFFTEFLQSGSGSAKKYAKSSLSEEDKNDILKRLQVSMQTEKYYRSNIASQSHLSRKLLIPAHHISQVINEKLGQSFFEFIAIYRIKEAEVILSDPGKRELTIDEIAEEVGYSSKSAFNKTFKKLTGKTPSEYRS